MTICLILMNNQVYSRYLYQMLMEFGSVSVPSMGTFALQYTEATFKDNKSILSPPSSKVVFIKDDFSASSLCLLLVESGMSHNHAQKLEKLLVDDYQSALERHIPFDLDSFGTIVNRIFLVKEDKIFNRYLGMGDVSVKPVTAPVVHDEKYLYGLNHSVKSNQDKDMKNYILPLLIGLFVLIFILAWLFTAKYNPQKVNTEIPVATIEHDTNQNMEGDTDSSLITDHDASSTDESEISNDNQANDDQKSKKVITESAKNKPTTPIIDNTFEANTCVVIVGSFKNSANANKMLKSIAAKGYKTYSATFNGLKRVGVSYDCRTNDPDTFKTKVKKTFHKDAWYLHDTL